MAASLTASAQLNYSGSALSGLDYSSYYSGDAQYVAGTPDVAQLYTADLSVDGDSPAVFVQISAPMTLDSLTASYSTSAGTTVAPYWLIYMTDDTGFTTPIVSTGSGPLNGSSLIHTGDLTHGSITLSALDTTIDPNSGLEYGDEDIAWVGLEIGDGGSGSGTANIDSITLSSVPEPTTIISGALMLLPFGVGAFRVLRKSLRA
ncbi:MAG TPA: hypothetical protein VGI03_06770 [Verrucomicrobiae bacterium]